MTNARKIHDIPLIDRPREKLQRKGVHALSDFELLEVMIGSGNKMSDVGTIARRTLKLLRAGTDSLNIDALMNIPGIHLAQASKLLAGLELARRHLVRDVRPLKTEADVLARLDGIRTKQQEYFVCLSLDGAHRLIAQRIVTMGTLDTVLAHPREVFADPLVDRAACIIVAHNHPSGDVEPSQKDIALTQQLAAAGHLLGIPLYDHLIVTKTEHVSLRTRKIV